MHKPLFWQLLFGTLTWQRIATILVPGILASIVVWRYDDGDWIARLVLAVATVDIVSGGISNATQSTRARWQTQPRWQHWVFIGGHAIIYPLVIWQLSTNMVIVSGLVSLLIGKTLLFAWGTLSSR